MTLSFAALLALIVGERVSKAAGAVLLWPALAVGVSSLLLWRGTDDLRLYFWVQFFPAFAAMLLFSLYPAKYTGAYYWIVAMALYALAILFEFTDEAIYSVGGLVSGHTLKHLPPRRHVLRYFDISRFAIRQPCRSGLACRPARDKRETVFLVRVKLFDCVSNCPPDLRVKVVFDFVRGFCFLSCYLLPPERRTPLTANARPV